MATASKAEKARAWLAGERARREKADGRAVKAAENEAKAVAALNEDERRAAALVEHEETFKEGRDQEARLSAEFDQKTTKWQQQMGNALAAIHDDALFREAAGKDGRPFRGFKSYVRERLHCSHTRAYQLMQMAAAANSIPQFETAIRELFLESPPSESVVRAAGPVETERNATGEWVLTPQSQAHVEAVLAKAVTDFNLDQGRRPTAEQVAEARRSLKTGEPGRRKEKREKPAEGRVAIEVSIKVSPHQGRSWTISGYTDAAPAEELGGEMDVLGWVHKNPARFRYKRAGV